MKKILLITALLFLSGCGQIISENQISNESTPIVKKDSVTIVKFFDFQCGFCNQGNTTMKTVKAQFGDKVEIKYMHFPVKSGSRDLAEASECARSQNKFNEFKDEYFEKHFGLSDTKTITTVAETVNLNLSEFNTCVRSDVKLSTIDENIQAGKKIGVQAVPFFVIENQALKGAYPYPVFEKILNAHLKDDSDK